MSALKRTENRDNFGSETCVILLALIWRWYTQAPDLVDAKGYPPSSATWQAILGGAYAYL